MRIKAKDRVGTVINNWKILNIAGRSNTGMALFQAQSLISGRIVTAYCHHLQQGKYAHIKQVAYDRKLRSTWHNMIRRCYDINNENYAYYGAKGITVCQDWLDDFVNFKEWAEEHGYKKHLTIDRINPHKGYEPDNCQWISRSQNSKWTKRSSKIWIENIYCDTECGWSRKVGRYNSWFSQMRYNHCYDYAYQKLLDRIKELGGIKKVMGVSEEEPDIIRFLKDIENDRLEVDL